MAQLTIREMEDILLPMVNLALGWKPEERKARISWQAEEAPFPKKPTDLAFLKVTPTPSVPNQFRSVSYNQLGQAVITGQRVMNGSLIFYGEDSSAYENAQMFRNWLFTPQAAAMFQASGLALLIRLPEVQRIPERIKSTWWDRADFSFQFNAETEYTQPMEYIDEIGEIGLRVNR